MLRPDGRQRMFSIQKKQAKTIVGMILAFSLFLSLFLVPVLRTEKGVYNPPGPESYENLLLGQRLEFGVYQNHINVFHVIINLLHRVSQSNLALFAFQSLAGLVSIFIFNQVLKRFRLKPEIRMVSVLLLVLSPLFIYSSTSFVAYLLILIFSLFAAYFALKGKPLLSGLSLAVLAFFDLSSLVVSLGLSLIFYLKRTKAKNSREWVLIVLPCLAMLFLSVFVFRFNIFEAADPKLSLVFSDFGALFGYSAFIVIMAFIEIIAWFEKKKNSIYILLFLLAFAASFYLPSLRLPCAVVFATFAALAIDALFRRIWSWDLLMQATALIIICTVVFSAVAFMSLAVKSEPTPQMTSALKVLRAKENNYAVLSHPENEFYINYFSGHMAVNGRFSRENSFSEDMLEIFYSIKLDRTRELMDQYVIGYVFLTLPMKKGQVWSRSEEGLLFLFANSEMFIKLYESSGYEVWGYALKENII